MEEYAKMDVKGELGRGAFGVVYLVKHQDGEDQFAVKVIELRGASKTGVEGEKEEATLLWKLNHINIVKYVTSYELSGALFIVTEFCAGGDLHSYLYKTSDDQLPEDLILAWATQIARALEYLHSRNVLHRDLKPANVYLTSEADVRVGDLGLARVLGNADMTTNSIVGTTAYQSPECYRGLPYNRKTDIWSLGCVILEMAERKKESGHIANLLYLFSYLQQGKLPLMVNSSRELKNLVYTLLSDSPGKRPEAAEFLAHPLIDAVVKKNERPGQVIRRCKTRPVDTGARPLRQSFFSIRPEDVRISASVLDACRSRQSCDEADSFSLDESDWVLVQPELRELGLEVIYRVLGAGLGDSSGPQLKETLTDEDRADSASVREFYLKRFAELRSGYRHALSEVKLNAALDAIARADDLDLAWTTLGHVLGDKLAEYGQSLVLLYMAELGCGKHCSYGPREASATRSCWPF